MNLLNDFDKWIVERKRRKKRSHNPSGLTRCNRQMVYDWLGYEKSDPPAPGGALKMEMGNIIEHNLFYKWADARVKDGTFKNVWKQVEVTLSYDFLKYDIHGYQDGVVELPDGSLIGVDCKSSFGRGIKNVRDSGMPKDDVIYQVYAYMLANPHYAEYHTLHFGRDNGYRTEFAYKMHYKGLLVYLVSDDGRYYNGTLFELDWNKALGKLEFVEDCVHAEELPDCQYKPAIKEGAIQDTVQRHGVKYKTDFQCAYCDYKSRCWAEQIKASRNEGKIFYGKEEI